MEPTTDAAGRQRRHAAQAGAASPLVLLSCRLANVVRHHQAASTVDQHILCGFRAMCLLVVVCCCIRQYSTVPCLSHSPPALLGLKEPLGASTVLTPLHLCVCVCACTIVCVLCAAWLCQTEDYHFETLSRRDITVSCTGLWRFQV